MKKYKRPLIFAACALSILLISVFFYLFTNISAQLNHSLHDEKLMSINFGFLAALIFIIATSVIAFIKFLIESIAKKEPKEFWNIAIFAVGFIDLCAIGNFFPLLSIQ